MVERGLGLNGENGEPTEKTTSRAGKKFGVQERRKIRSLVGGVEK